MALSVLTRIQGANRALKDGSMSSPEVPLMFVDEPVLVNGFRKMVRNLEFDISEMALTTYITAKEHGVEFTALPVFLVRDFHHGATQVLRANSGQPVSSLTGGRIGINRGYTVTTGVWGRSALAQAGLDLETVTWVCSGDEHVASYHPPKNVVRASEGSSLETMLLEGELDAVVGANISHPDVVTLSQDPDDAAAEVLRKSGIFPINHLVVIRNELLRQDASLATKVFTIFAEAKRRYIESLQKHSDGSRQDQILLRVMEITGEDPLPYGIEPNRETLNALVDAALSQHIIRKRPSLEDLFASETRDLRG